MHRRVDGPRPGGTIELGSWYTDLIVRRRASSPWSLKLLLEQTRAFGLDVREEECQMSEGTIKKVVADRGFGFIQAEDGKEYFFHRTGMDATLNFDALTGGERVSFDVEASPKGPRANRVRIV